MTAIKQTQGSTVAATITLAELANAAGRQSAVLDLGETFPEFVRVELTVDFSSAPTAGLTMDVYLSSSVDGSLFDGECTGSDAAYSTLADCARLRFVGSLAASNSTNQQRASWIMRVPSRYIALVVWNASGQALTAVGGDQVLRVTPLIGDAT